jgi:hypothetical protein
MNKPYQYSSNIIGHSRHSVPLEAFNYDPQKISSTQQTTNKIRSNHWKNYQFENQEPKIENKKTDPTQEDNEIQNSTPSPTQILPSNQITKKTHPTTRIKITKDKSPQTKPKELMSINIKQLPGLKESHSTGGLHIPKSISHVKNRSNDFSKNRSNSQLRKFIDSNGNVRFKFMNKPKQIEMDRNGVKQYSSANRQNVLAYAIQNSSLQMKQH